MRRSINLGYSIGVSVTQRLNDLTSTLLSLITGSTMLPLRTGISKVLALGSSLITITPSLVVVAASIVCVNTISSPNLLDCGLMCLGFYVLVFLRIIPLVGVEIQRRGLPSLALTTEFVFRLSAWGSAALSL